MQKLEEEMMLREESFKRGEAYGVLTSTGSIVRNKMNKLNASFEVACEDLGIEPTEELKEFVMR